MEDYDISGAAGLNLHHFYRAIAWLGEEMEPKSEDALAPRCVKDVIEDTLFDKRRVLSAMFMDTTSLSFYGEGGETLGEHGYSKDYQPDLKQMILALIVDGAGRPISTEMWSGNTADVAMLLPVIDRLRRRFSIGRVCVVADRGMISAATIEGLEARKLEYILGARAKQSGAAESDNWRARMRKDGSWNSLPLRQVSSALMSQRIVAMGPFAHQVRPLSSRVTARAWNSSPTICAPWPRL